MENILLMPAQPEIETLSARLGFSRTMFQGRDFQYLQGEDRRKISRETARAIQQRKLSLVRVSSPEMLRFLLEKTAVSKILGMEQLFAKDSVHYPRSGLDQVLCRLAAGRKVTLAFSFSDILHSPNRPQLLGRMSFNLALCRKYGVKIVFSNFSAAKEDLRSAADLQSFGRVLGAQLKF